MIPVGGSGGNGHPAPIKALYINNISARAVGCRRELLAGEAPGKHCGRTRVAKHSTAARAADRQARSRMNGGHNGAERRSYRACAPRCSRSRRCVCGLARAQRRPRERARAPGASRNPWGSNPPGTRRRAPAPTSNCGFTKAARIENFGPFHRLQRRGLAEHMIGAKD